MAMSDTRDTVLLSSDGTDQRKHPRFHVSLSVSFGDGANSRTGTVVDISREGCRIRCDDVVPRERYFRVEIRLGDPPDTLTIDLAVMRWSRHGECGIEFIRMEPDGQARLRSMIQNCEEECLRRDCRRDVQRELLEPT
jgi:PilZ domain-containing protein